MTQSYASRVADMDPRSREMFLLGLTPDELNAMRWDWRFWARPEQLEPDGTWWSTWLALAGRGYGKTRLGSEWIRSQVCGATPLSPGKCSRVALVAETAADARDVMVKGPSGMLQVHPPDFRPVYKPSNRSLEWPNGAIALLFSAEEPDQLRGPEHDLAWSDELAKWRYSQETWDMLQFGLRIGDMPRQLVTTTPRPIPIVRELIDNEWKVGGTVVTRGSTFDNRSNLASNFMRKMRDKYEGTRLGRQELFAEVLNDVPGALWQRKQFDRRSRVNPLGAVMSQEEKLPELRRVVVGVDPSGTNGEEDGGDDVGIVAAALGVDGRGYILEDGTVALGPAGWARQVIRMYETHRADLVVGESNYGGAMIEFTIKTVRRNVNYRNVVASRGKAIRAEPIAALYEQGRVRHLGAMPQLEDQMCNMSSTGYLGRGSPDRLDAAVWALTELMLGADGRVITGGVRGMV